MEVDVMGVGVSCACWRALVGIFFKTALFLLLLVQLEIHSSHQWAWTSQETIPAPIKAQNPIHHKMAFIFAGSMSDEIAFNLSRSVFINDHRRSYRLFKWFSEKGDVSVSNTRHFIDYINQLIRQRRYWPRSLTQLVKIVDRCQFTTSKKSTWNGHSDIIYLSALTLKHSSRFSFLL